jgi:hypothetical protein
MGRSFGTVADHRPYGVRPDGALDRRCDRAPAVAWGGFETLKLIRKFAACRWATVGLLGASALVCGATALHAQSAPLGSPERLTANDVSILFPVPKTQEDLDGLIALSDLTEPAGAPQPARLWSDADFQSFLRIAESPEVQVAGANFPLELPDDVKNINAWFIAGIRIDPGAPGLSKEIIDQLGQQPQIRFIIQPVTRLAGNKVQVHDIAGHLIFSFSTAVPDAPAVAGCLPRSKPDMTAFQNVVRDIVALRDQLAAGQFGGAKIATAGRPLSVHPGLMGVSARSFRDAIKRMLEKNLASQRLTSMAIMGLNEPEPWIFIAMQKVPVRGFIPVPGPTLDGRQVAQMLSFRGDQRVIPAPVTNNQNPITCRHAAFQNPPLPGSERKGVATADFFDRQAVEARTRESVDIIADPKKSHFFNTDCISCHTDTRQGMERITNFTVADVDPQVLPKENWNVRNFGWFPSFFHPGVVDATVTRRTAAETAEVVEFINKELLDK